MNLKEKFKEYPVLYSAIEFTQEEEWQCLIDVKDYRSCADFLKNNKEIPFEQLIDLTAVDFLTYGVSQWRTDRATAEGFSRAVLDQAFKLGAQDVRFQLVIHFLSYQCNTRLRLKIFVPPLLEMPTLSDLWPNADWYEREVFDLFGIIFKNHQDLRRILTDYGFIGHPFRKDFPLTGEVELRYDEYHQSCIYETISIENRILIPKVIR